MENKESRVDTFLEELNELCLKHKLCISHEDQHGAFIIKDYDEATIDWLNEANIEIKD